MVSHTLTRTRLVVFLNQLGFEIWEEGGNHRVNNLFLAIPIFLQTWSLLQLIWLIVELQALTKGNIVFSLLLVIPGPWNVFFLMWYECPCNVNPSLSWIELFIMGNLSDLCFCMFLRLIYRRWLDLRDENNFAWN